MISRRKASASSGSRTAISGRGTRGPSTKSTGLRASTPSFTACSNAVWSTRRAYATVLLLYVRLVLTFIFCAIRTCHNRTRAGSSLSSLMPPSSGTMCNRTSTSYPRNVQGARFERTTDSSQISIHCPTVGVRPGTSIPCSRFRSSSRRFASASFRVFAALSTRWPFTVTAHTQKPSEAQRYTVPTPSRRGSSTGIRWSRNVVARSGFDPRL